MKEKHIENLTKGRKSGKHIGSRRVPHRLRPHEQAEFSRAIKRKFLRLKFDSRQNLFHIWSKYCEAKDWPLIVVNQEQSGKSRVTWENKTRDFPSPKEACQFANELVNLS